MWFSCNTYAIISAMNSHLIQILSRLIRIDLAYEEKRKRLILLLFQIPMAPLLLAISLVYLRRDGFTFEVGLLWFAVVLDLYSLWTIGHLENIQIVSRVINASVISVLLFELTIGSAAGIAFLWFYFYPLFSFVLFGKREGFFWVAFTWIMTAAAMLLDFGTYQYPPEVTGTFILSYTLVSAISYCLEAARNHSYQQLQAEKIALEETLHQIQLLHKLFPLCGGCKKIRDDQGFWHQVEGYIMKQRAVTFTHSICPDCRDALFGRTHGTNKAPLTEYSVSEHSIRKRSVREHSVR